MHGTTTFRHLIGVVAAVFAFTAGAQVPPGHQAPQTPQQQPQPGPSGQGGQSAGANAGLATGVPQMPKAFRDQLDRLAWRNIGEIQAGNLVAQRAQTPQVRQLGTRIAQERNQMNQSLMQQGRAHGYQVNQPTGQEQQWLNTVLQRIQQAQGVDLDQKYLSVLLRDLPKDERLLKDMRAAVPGQDASLKGWLNQAENVVERELSSARQLQGQVRVQARRPPAR